MKDTFRILPSGSIREDLKLTDLCKTKGKESPRPFKLTFPMPAWACPILTTTGNEGVVTWRQEQRHVWWYDSRLCCAAVLEYSFSHGR